jgi:methylenetetrahydrofolate dehydrogenase (NADP+)/methenyltetrahydrofolate cyclohydrolase
VSAGVTARVLEGGAIAAEIQEQVRARIVRLAQRGIVPGLAVATVGEPPAGNPYVRAKCRAAERLGAKATVVRLPAEASEAQVREALTRLNADPAIHGIILQVPLPAALDEERFLECVSPEKDVDGVHPLNVGRWTSGLPAHRPATPLGVIELLRRQVGNLDGKRVVVLGRSRIVGRPLAILLSQRASGMNATVTLCHSHTADLPAITREAEILIVAIGRRKAIRAEHVRPGAVVIDVGIHPVEAPAPGAARFEGDVDFESVSRIASAVTPVPGGVGPMTVAMILRNLTDAAEAAGGLA